VSTNQGETVSHTLAANPANPTTALDLPEPRSTAHRIRAVADRLPEVAPLLLVLVAMSAFFSARSPYFLSVDNFVNILQAVCVTGIVALPATMLIVAGEFDLSVGATAAFCAVLMATQAAEHGVARGVLIALAAGLLIGLVNAFVVTVIGVSSLITTLGMLSVLSGLALQQTGGQTAQVADFASLGTSRPFLDIPLPVLIFLALTILTAFVLRMTVFGRCLYAIGANPTAARLVGVRSRTSLFVTFVSSSVAAALAGLILASQLGAASPTAGAGLELVVITAVVLGGASLRGGRGTVIGTFVAVLILGALQNGLVLLNVGAYAQDIATGMLLIAAVSFDQIRRRF
jgi:ribose transport system permease protein